MVAAVLVKEGEVMEERNDGKGGRKDKGGVKEGKKRIEGAEKQEHS